MTTQVENIALANARLAAAIVNLKAQTGNLALLNTTNKTTLVAALNEVHAALTTAGIEINDSANALTTTWSSNKIQAQITAAVTALLGGADANNDTLSEIASQVAALAQADAGLVSAAGVQAFTEAQKLQACQNIGIGNPAFDYLPAINAILDPVGL